MNIEIHLNEGMIIVTFYENYVASELAILLNDSTKHMLNFGDTILAKHTIKLIKPVEAV